MIEQSFAERDAGLPAPWVHVPKGEPVVEKTCKSRTVQPRRATFGVVTGSKDARSCLTRHAVSTPVMNMDCLRSPLQTDNATMRETVPQPTAGTPWSSVVPRCCEHICHEQQRGHS